MPTLFDGTKDSKRVEFSTGMGDFNSYIKYSTKMVESTTSIKVGKRKKVSWNIIFSDKDYKILKDSFYTKGRNNFICLVCANKKLNVTYLAALEYENAMKCLNKSTPSGSRRITVTRTGGEYNFNCYGVGFKEEDFIQIPVDPTNFLGLKE